MIVYELTGAEQHPEYKRLEQSNLIRQLNYMESLVNTAVNIDRKFLSQIVIKALNYQAITCLHVKAGEYRPCQVVALFNPLSPDGQFCPNFLTLGISLEMGTVGANYGFGALNAA